MDARRVLADSHPLIALAAVGHFELLHQLFGRITITTSVEQEVMARPGLSGAAEVADADLRPARDGCPTPSDRDEAGLPGDGLVGADRPSFSWTPRELQDRQGAWCVQSPSSMPATGSTPYQVP